MDTTQTEKVEGNSSPPMKEGVGDLKKRLEELDKQKEEWFLKKESLKSEIAKLINEIREVRKKKEELAGKVKPLKDNRDKHNAEVKTLIDVLKTHKKSSEERRNKFGSATPESLKTRMDHLEHTLETQALSFDKEKTIMKEMNQLKKKYDAIKDFKDNVDLKDVSQKIDEAKKKADEFHAELQACLKENKELSRNFSRISKEINALKKVQEEAFAKFIKFKQEFLEVNNALKGKQDTIKADVEKKRKIQETRRKENKRNEEQKANKDLKKKAEEVEEKLKNKKTLTTEDILAFQGLKED